MSCKSGNAPVAIFTIPKKATMNTELIPVPHGKKFPQTGFALSAAQKKKTSGKQIKKKIANWSREVPRYSSSDGIEISFCCGLYQKVKSCAPIWAARNRSSNPFHTVLKDKAMEAIAFMAFLFRMEGKSRSKNLLINSMKLVLDIFCPGRKIRLLRRK